MNKYQEALDEIENRFADLCGLSGVHAYDEKYQIDEYFNLVNQGLNRLEELEKRATPMKPIIDDEQPICPICKIDLYKGKGIMEHYTDYYCVKCGQALDWSDNK